MHSTRRSLAGLAQGLATPAMAQAEWPTRPVTLLVPFAPGGAYDLASRLSREAGEQFIQVDLARWRELATSENIRVE